MPNLTDFGEQFAGKVLERFYVNSVAPAITNTEYEGEIKKLGDRVNILSFLQNIELGDYVVGSDMTVGQVVDAEDQLVVEKRKYFDFSLDRLENLFTYAGNIPEHLLANASNEVVKGVDTYVLAKFASDTKAGNWIGTNFIVLGSSQTRASLTTTSTGGNIIIEGEVDDEASMFTASENPLSGTILYGGFENSDLYKGIRLLSTRAIVSPWWRISSITSTVKVAITEWDEEVSGPEFAENYTLRGVFGGDGVTFPKYTDHNGTDTGTWVAAAGSFGWEIQAAEATAISATSIYDQATLLGEKLDTNEIPDTDRFLVLPEFGVTALKQASETQPTGIAEIYSGTVLNGRVGRIGGFEVVKTLSSRLSSRAGHSTQGVIGVDQTLTAGPTGYIIPAAHKGAVTFAEKWTENRVVDAEKQFAKLYQGLFLYGALVPKARRKYSAVLFANI